MSTIKRRGFEIISNYVDKGLNLPLRQTKSAAGYDFEAAEDIVIPTIWKKVWNKWFDNDTIRATLIPTGIKSYMGQDEYLQLSIRSGMALKSGLLLANGIGVVDADYYNNESNEGHIMFAVYNFGFVDKKISKGERIGQGIFLPFLKADNDVVTNDRSGGFGSTGSEVK